MKANPESLKAILKQALQGKVTADEVQQSISQATMEFSQVLEVAPGVYDIAGGPSGLTDAEMRAATLEMKKAPLITRIIRSSVPVFHSEREAEQHINKPFRFLD
jgi:hypothetical protein